MSLLSKIHELGSDIVALRRCAVCGEVLLAGEDALCLKCLESLPRTLIHLTPVNPVADYVSNGVAPVGFVASWFHYDPVSVHARLILDAKYADHPRLAFGLGRLFARELLDAKPVDTDIPDDFDLDAGGCESIADIDVLLPVPMHWTKRIRRGYNQSVEIARGISSVTGIPVADNLVATKRHSTQTRKGRVQRHSNIANTMALRYPQELDGLNIAFVDDIVTSGATAAECVRALSTSGARPATIGLLSLGLTVKRK